MPGQRARKLKSSRLRVYRCLMRMVCSVGIFLLAILFAIHPQTDFQKWMLRYMVMDYEQLSVFLEWHRPLVAYTK